MATPQPPGDSPANPQAPVISWPCRSLWASWQRPAEPEQWLRHLAEEVQQVRGRGASALEFHGDACVLDVRYADPELWRRAAEVVLGQGLQATVHLPYRWTDLAALDRGVWEGSLQSLVTAVRATAPLQPLLWSVHPASYVTQVYVGRASPDQRMPLLEAAAERVVAGLRRLAQVAGPPLALENLEGVPLDLFQQVVEAAEVGVCLDVGHLVSDGEEPVTVVAALGPSLVGLHLHDALPPPDRCAHLPLGRGRLDLSALARALRTAGFSGPAVLEVDGDEEVYAENTRRWGEAMQVKP